MFVIRPIEEKDYHALETIAFTAHAGLLSLPKNPTLLKRKLHAAIDAINRKITSPDHETYLFVLENTSTGKIGGTCGIYSRTGVINPVYSFALIDEEPAMRDIGRDIKVLKVRKHAPGPTEMCSLYLLPDFRKGGLGRLLSLSRYLYIASHPQRFESKIIASLRGVIDKNGNSPFWQHVGRHFFESSFEEMFAMIQNDPSVVQHLLPKHPIYVPLLNPQAQKVINRPHANSVPALRMLSGEGFACSGEVDLFDAGPIVSAETQMIRTIQKSCVATITKISADKNDNMNSIIATINSDFRCCLGQVRNNGNDTIVINEEACRLLKIGIGDLVRYVSLKG